MRRQIISIKNSIGAIYKNLGRIPFIFILVAIAIYFWINGASHFPSWGTNQSNIIMIYIIMLVGFTVWAKKTEKQLFMPVSYSAFTFVFFFIVTWAVLLGLISLGLLTPASDFQMSLFFPMLILQVCVVAPTEEVIFRGILLEYTGILVQAVLFALWHSYAYEILWYNIDINTIRWGALFFAFIMGLLLGFIAKNKRWGLPATIGIHACYNLVILGALNII